MRNCNQRKSNCRLVSQEKKQNSAEIIHSDSNGTIKYVLEPMNTDSIKISVQADSLRYTSSSSILKHPYDKQIFYPFFSPSGSFIQLENVDNALPCGKQKNIRLLFTSKENSMFKFNYQASEKQVSRIDVSAATSVGRYGSCSVLATVDPISGRNTNDQDTIRKWPLPAAATSLASIQRHLKFKRNHKETTDRSWLEEPTSAKTLTTDPTSKLDFCRPRATWSVTDWRRVNFRFKIRVWRRTGQP
ncbi:alpha-2-macroglobulin-like protein 1 [Trichonephila clavipes]|nr:alpha-2-macroglobulin-like protein 1 [Trichonephila clavipes]